MSNWARTFLISALVSLACGGQCFGWNPVPSGDEWSTWSDDTRIGYISTYMLGYARGFRDACETGQEIYSNEKPTRAPRDKCFDKAYKYSKNIEDYAAAITEYYHAYPSDRKVPVFELLEGLSDARNLSPQKMHQYYGSPEKRSQ
jgi:hypothetical protein